MKAIDRMSMTEVELTQYQTEIEKEYEEWNDLLEQKFDVAIFKHTRELFGILDAIEAEFEMRALEDAAEQAKFEEEYFGPGGAYERQYCGM